MMVENIVELPDFTVEIHALEGDLFALPADMSPRHRGSRDRVARVTEMVALNEELAAFSAIEAQFGRRFKDALVDEVSPYTDIQFPGLFEDELNIFGVEAVEMPPSPSFRSGSDEDSSSETAKHRSKSKKNRNLSTKGKRRRQPQMVEIVDIHPILLAGEDVEIELSEHRRTPKRPVSPQSLSNSHYHHSTGNSANTTPFAPPSTPQPGSQYSTQQQQQQPMTPSTPTSSSTLPFLAPTPRRPGKGTPGSKSAAAKERKEKRSAAAAGSPGAGAKDECNGVGDPKTLASVDIRTLSFQGEEVLRIKQINTEESVEVDVGDDFDC
jgi:hypothetical protein